jgi:hypothetical protein
MFWLYLLGLVLVAGAELNAFLEEPGRATALAASKARAEKGQAEVHQAGGTVEAEATGTAWAGGEETRGTAEEKPGPFGRRPARAGADQRGRPEPGRQLHCGQAHRVRWPGRGGAAAARPALDSGAGVLAAMSRVGLPAGPGPPEVKRHSPTWTEGDAGC